MAKSIKHVVITGGAGFIGSNLVEYFNELEPETRVSVVDDLSTGDLENLEGSSFELHQVSILETRKLEKIFSGADAVIHLAARGSVPRSIADPAATNHVNVVGTVSVLEACRIARVNHVVFASSSSVYGGNTARLKSENDWVAPLSPYAASKLASESYCLAYQATYGLKVLAFRFFNVYGPRQSSSNDYAAVIPKFLSAALSGHPLVIHGDGDQSRDFTHVSSVCAAIHLAVVGQVSNTRPLNLAFGTSTTIMELARLVEMEVGGELEIRFESPRTGDVMRSQAETSQLKKIIPSLEAVPILEGLRSTVDWFRTRTNIRSSGGDRREN